MEEVFHEEIPKIIVYLDPNFVCHLENEEGFIPFETSFFHGWEYMITNYRIIPSGYTWTREDGVSFSGEAFFCVSDPTIFNEG